MLKTATFSAILTIAPSGCLVFPYRVQLQPNVTGKILANGQPVAGAKVFVFPYLRDISQSEQPGWDGSGVCAIVRD